MKSNLKTFKNLRMDDAKCYFICKKYNVLTRAANHGHSLGSDGDPPTILVIANFFE